MADAPHEGSEATPLGSGKGRPPQAEAVTAERNPADASPVENPGLRLGRHFEQALSLSRVVVVVPVIILLLSAMASFAYGTDVFVRSVAHVVDNSQLTSHNLGFLLLLTDLFLIGATLMIAAFGFYDLFIGRIGASDPGIWLPGWLRMHDLNDLKARVISMIILVAGVSFVDDVVESKGGLDTLYLGVGVAVVIAALTAFLHFGRMDGGERS
ncbi:MAG TPA: YqhA family protein [Isosphaeraceae bacterium]|nr:YqhA family protein [Isosphaeraceae bacterium]